VTVTVPGNLLLLGEYAVLEPGGLGVTLALERRVVIRVEPALRLEVLGFWGREAVHWSDQRPESSPLFTEVVRACRLVLADHFSAVVRSRAGSVAKPVSGLRPGGEEPVGEPAGNGGPPEKLAGEKPGPETLAGRILIDSSAFFFSPERKSGFGSSAAVTVGLAWTILLLGGMEPEQVRRIVPGLALQAHRAVQGGGSGYDVLTSAHGGIGLFTGGTKPGWEARALPWLPSLFLLRGPASVSSVRAVESYRRWKAANSREARRFLEDSNEAVRDFLAAGSWPEAEVAFRRSLALGLWLGEQIGVDARLNVPAELQVAVCKALGAGNELGLVVQPSEASTAGGEGAPAVGVLGEVPDSLETLVPAWEGVLCEP
jgi:mevalonate kinase